MIQHFLQNQRFSKLAKYEKSEKRFQKKVFLLIKKTTALKDRFHI